MTAIGIVMSAIFLHVCFAPFARFKRSVAAEDWKAGGAALNQIRILVGTNLALGLLNIAVAMLGRGLHLPSFIREMRHPRLAAFR